MTAKPDYAANLALYLLEKTGSIWGVVEARMTAEEQRQLFGQFLGKGRIVIDGLQETICNRVKVAFGADWDDRKVKRWAEL